MGFTGGMVFMKTIWKMKLKPTGQQTFDVMAGAKVLTVQMQGETPCMWLMLDPDSESRERMTIEIFGTGHPMHDFEREYIGTYQIDGGAYIFHVFRRTD
jgi:hypothetical protein